MAETIQDFRRVLEVVRGRVDFLERENERLQKGNAELRRALQMDLSKQTVKFREIESKLDALEKPILNVILEGSKRLERPLNYEEIVKYFRNRYPSFNVKTQSIMRRVRYLKEKGLLISTKPGYFYPNIA